MRTLKSSQYSGSLRRKFSAWVSLLVLILIAGSSLITLHMIQDTLQQEMIRRGHALSISMASPAAFSLLAEDRLALDHLVSRIEASQDDILFAGVADGHGVLLAHSDLSLSGERVRPQRGAFLAGGEDFTVWRIEQPAETFFEFRAPVFFSNKPLGEVVLGISTEGLEQAIAAARQQVALLALVVLVIGLAGAHWLGTVVYRPIRHLSNGVAGLQSGHFSEAPVLASDELGKLTESFNTMAREILEQREALSQRAEQLEEGYQASVRLLAAAIDARDEYTLGHSTRVAALALQVGRRLNLSRQELNDLSVSCFLHDVGKIRIPDRILKKRAPLSSREREILLQHPRHGADILCLSESLHRYIPAVLHHHEWYNGEGYPEGLKGEEIPRDAAILALADAYDAMTTSRPYRMALGRAEAVRELERFSGTQFCPTLTRIFVNSLEDAMEEDPRIYVEGVA